MKKHLTICSPQLGMNPNSDLGGEIHDYNILKELAKLGNKIVVYLPKGRNFEKNKNITVKHAPFKHVPAFLFNLLILPFLISSYKKEKFDILRVHNPYFVGIGALVYKFFNKNVQITTTHHLKEKGFIFNLINKLTAKKYDAVFAVSEYIKKWLITSYGIPEEKVHVIYNGVSEDFKPIKKNLNLIKELHLEGKFVILYMGLLIKRKNPEFLLKVFENLKKSNKNIALIICGKGPLKKTLEEYSKENNIKDIHFAGVISGKKKVDYFNLCDIFALPSENEGFGLVIAEAMACAKPVIITNRWSSKEAITDNQEGFLAKYNSLSEWTNKIEYLIRHPVIAKKLGENALLKSKKFSWKYSAMQMDTIFHKLI